MVAHVRTHTRLLSFPHRDHIDTAFSVDESSQLIERATGQPLLINKTTTWSLLLDNAHLQHTAERNTPQQHHQLTKYNEERKKNFWKKRKELRASLDLSFCRVDRVRAAAKGEFYRVEWRNSNLHRIVCVQIRRQQQANICCLDDYWQYIYNFSFFVVCCWSVFWPILRSYRVRITCCVWLQSGDNNNKKVTQSRSFTMAVAWFMSAL